MFSKLVRSCDIWGEIMFLVGSISFFCGPYVVERDGSSH